MDDPQVRGDILVVDDNPVNLRLLSRMLTGKNYRVRLAENGTDALVAAKSTLPDLVLLDILMPGIDGYEVCRQLKADQGTREIPVLFLSALSGTEDKVAGFRAGAVDYIGKPFHVEEVLARVETHLALCRTRRHLQQQIAELDAFAHTVAHDLKNPLATLAGFAEMLSDDLSKTGDPRVETYATPIVRTARRMIKIVDELLLLASVRKAALLLEPVDMAAGISEAADGLHQLICERHAELLIPDPGAWPKAMGYTPWIQEVWSNLLSNAIKYGGTPPRVEAGGSFVEREGTESSRVRFWVRDNGVGITPEAQAFLFQEFSRRTSRLRGHGLGLSIVKRIIERLGGTVGVESAPEGSCFFFTLPAAPEESRPGGSGSP